MNPRDLAPEGRLVRIGVATAVAMIAQQVGSKVTRDTLFLTNFSAQDLPKIAVPGALLALVTALITARAMARFGPGRVAWTTFSISGVLFAAEWVAFSFAPSVVAVLVFLHVQTLGAVSISGFWSVVNERFDPHAARRNIARITTGATLGGLLGGVAAHQVGAAFQASSVLLALAAGNLACAFGIRHLGRGLREGGTTAPGALAGVMRLKESAFLRNVAWFIAIIALIEVFLDYLLKAEAEAALAETELLTFFAIFYTGVGLATFLLQALASDRILARLGLAGTLMVLPGVVLSAGVVGTIAAGLVTATLVAGLEAVLANSLQRSAYELLYTPVPRAEKRAVKAVIDVSIKRLATMLGGGVVFVVLAIGVGVAPLLFGLTALLAAAAVVHAVRLHRGYVESLATSLKNGVIALAESDIRDATTRQTIAETTMALDRERLLAEIAALREGSARTMPAIVDPTTLPPGPRAPAVDPAVAQVRTLCQGRPEEIRALLARTDLDERLVPFIIPLLSKKRLTREAAEALSRLLPRIAGALADALLDTSAPRAVRTAIPRLLQRSSDRRVQDALWAALEDDDFEIRFRAGRALSHAVAELGDAIEVSRLRVLERVRGEVEVDDETWDIRARLSVDEPQLPRPHRGLEHVFTLLGLTLDRKVVRLCFGALAGTDGRLRGTAIEYLENVLPEDLRTRIWPRLGAAQPAVRPRRAASQVVRELMVSVDALELPLDELDALGQGEPDG